jgi:dCTP deaminase
MSFLGVKDFINLQNQFKLVEPFNAARLKNGAYELSLGYEAYLTDSETGKVEILDDNKNREVHINPGQFALLLTGEKVHIPKNKIAFISIKAGEKLKGLVNVSGFHVDPGFHDKLLFSVYNAGPSTIVLNYGEPYFPIWFAELTSELQDNEAYNQNNEHFGKLNHIPPKYIEVLKRGELASPKALFDKIKEVENSLNEKIIKSDEKKDRSIWLYGIIIGLATTILLKLIWDGLDYNKGYVDGKNANLIIEQIKQEIQKPNLDSIVAFKVDSLLNKKIQNDSTKKRH